MAARNSNGKPRRDRAVLYLRMSTDRQETSIEEQRDELTRYAKRHGYNVVREYVDEAISGDKTERRTGFLTMRDDAGNGEFSIVLCWDQDRFGRFDLIDAGHWIKPFRDAGVRLETIAQGPVDWEDLTGQLIYHANQVGKAQFLRDLSRNVCRGLLANAREGRGTGGNRIPFGYRVHREFDDRGRLVDYRLVIVSEQAEIVRRIFRRYLETGGSYRAIAHELNSEGVPSPAQWQGLRIKHNGRWNITTVQGILKNRKYTGTYVWGRQGTGGYHTACGGEIQKRTKHDPRLKGEPIVHERKHEPIIDQETFDRVQDLTERRRTRTTPKKYRQYVLTGICRCGDCGGPMGGVKPSSKVGGYRLLCRTYGYSGKAGCYCNSIEETPVVETLVRKILDLYLSDAALDRLRQTIRQEQSRERSAGPVDGGDLRKRIAELDAKIERGSDRVFDAPEDLVPDLMKKLNGFRQERDTLKAQLRQLDGQPTAQDRKDDSEIEEAIQALRRLREALTDAEPAELSELLSSVFDRVVLYFEQGTKGKRRRSVFKRGKAYMRPAFGLSQLSEIEPHCVQPGTFTFTAADLRKEAQRRI